MAEMQAFDGSWLAAFFLVAAGAVSMLVAWRRRTEGRFRTFTMPACERPPSCVIRLLTPADLQACEEIYRLNEPGRFPPGMFDTFAAALREGQILFLVVEVEGRVRAFAGLSMLRKGRAELAQLWYGMVRPSCRGRGYGTALLQARLAMLPLARRAWTVFLTTTGGSETFYSRFGFSLSHPVPIASGQLLEGYCVLVDQSAQRRCAKAVEGILVAPAFGQNYVPKLLPASAPRL